MTSEVEDCGPSLSSEATERLIETLSEYGVLPPRLSPEADRSVSDAAHETIPAE
jgi:hypothetical protein